MTSRTSSFPSFVNKETAAPNWPQCHTITSVNIQTRCNYSHPLGQRAHRLFSLRKSMEKSYG